MASKDKSEHRIDDIGLTPAMGPKILNENQNINQIRKLTFVEFAQHHKTIIIKSQAIYHSDQEYACDSSCLFSTIGGLQLRLDSGA